ncbi:MAG: patatin-like phospholipase family protein [Acetobacteraceae bacterium]|nr:patatin-like phospholipase family protein [Acetobacteraceae bacterium]
MDAATVKTWLDAYPPKVPSPPCGTFEFGLCMAGAISAGAYTAGVLDLLFEALDAFDAEKQCRREKGDAPLHEVKLTVLGGASAGGMCAALAALFLPTRFAPVLPGRENCPAAKKNPLFSAWVDRIGIERLLETRDLGGGTLPSALDCTILDEIVEETLGARAAMSAAGADRGWLPERVRVLLTLSNLRGVPYALRFQGTAFSHFMWRHADEARFGVAVRPGGNAAPDEVTLDPHWPAGDPRRAMFHAAVLGTGAFPIALRSRLVSRPLSDYLLRAALHPRSFLAQGSASVVTNHPEWLREVTPDWDPREPDPYRMPVVDGGAMDNEPLELVRRSLAGWDAHNPRCGAKANRAVVLVDPFVAREAPGPGDDIGLAGAVLPLFNALIRNSRFKPEDLALAAAPENYSRFIIAPSRGSEWVGSSAIASGYLGGFLGFFHRDYRLHDFMLGRRNARSFLRQHFVLPEGNVLFQDGRWSDADKVRFRVKRAGAEGWHLPVVPLFGRLMPKSDPEAMAADEATIEPLRPWPAGRLDAAARKDLEARIERRAVAALELLYRQNEPQVTGFLSDLADGVIARRGWILRRGLGLVKPWLLRTAGAMLRGAACERAGRRIATEAMSQVGKAVAALDSQSPRP